MERHKLTEQLKGEAARLGFDLAAATPAVAPAGIEHLKQWLGRGFAGEMKYLADHVEAYHHPRYVLDGAKSILMLGVNYRTIEPGETDKGQGKLARYAWGRDYHEVVREKLNRLTDFHRNLLPDAGVRGVVDTTPLLEREFARRAGLGWIGRNTMLVNEQFGSWLFLAALLTTEELAYDKSAAVDHCGSCTACLDACPTEALVEPYCLDARKCLSYLTIEHRGPIPADLRSRLGDWLFGCDCCQRVCPHNQDTPRASEESFRPRPGANPVDLIELFTLDDTAFRKRFRDTPLGRSKRRGILRNAAVVLGNRPHEAALPALVRGLSDGEPLVRAACAWALGQYESDVARNALRERLNVETEVEVRAEMEVATHQ